METMAKLPNLQGAATAMPRMLGGHVFLELIAQGVHLHGLLEESDRWAKKRGKTVAFTKRLLKLSHKHSIRMRQIANFWIRFGRQCDVLLRYLGK